MDPEVEFRDASEDDLAEVARIHVAAWQSAYRGIIDDGMLDALEPEQRLPLWKQWWKGPGVRLILAVQRGRIVGFLRLCPARDFQNPPDGFAEFTHVYLDPEFIGTGTGGRLFDFGLRAVQGENYRGLLLWVLEANTRARRFYEGFGLAPDGARADQPAHLGPNVFEVRYCVLWDDL